MYSHMTEWFKPAEAVAEEADTERTTMGVSIPSLGVAAQRLRFCYQMYDIQFSSL